MKITNDWKGKQLNLKLGLGGSYRDIFGSNPGGLPTMSLTGGKSMSTFVVDPPSWSIPTTTESMLSWSARPRDRHPELPIWFMLLSMFRRQIDRQELKPIMIQGLVPLCSWQYERLFNTTRNTRSWNWQTCPSQWLSTHRRLLSWKVLQDECVSSIEASATERDWEDAGENPGWWITCNGRRRTLGCIDSCWSSHLGQSKEQLLLQRTQQDVARSDRNRGFCSLSRRRWLWVWSQRWFQLSEYGQSLLHGKGYDRWFDKSFTLVVAKNGRAGFNAEHSWADAPIMAHYWEFILSYEFEYLGYDENGKCKIGNGLDPPAAVRLKWDLPHDLTSTIQACLRSGLFSSTSVYLMAS